MCGDNIKTEIVITPGMIESGVSEFVQFDGRFEGPEDAVDSIYRAMEMARLGITSNRADNPGPGYLDPALPRR